MVTVGGGTLSAILAGFFETTLAHSLVLALFLTMVLGLNEKRQYAIDECDDSRVTVCSGHVALAGYRVSSRIDHCAPARCRVRAGRRLGCLDVAK